MGHVRVPNAAPRWKTSPRSPYSPRFQAARTVHSVVEVLRRIFRICTHPKEVESGEDPPVENISHSWERPRLDVVLRSPLGAKRVQG